MASVLRRRRRPATNNVIKVNRIPVSRKPAHFRRGRGAVKKVFVPATVLQKLGARLQKRSRVGLETTLLNVPQATPCPSSLALQFYKRMLHHRHNPTILTSRINRDTTNVQTKYIHNKQNSGIQIATSKNHARVSCVSHATSSMASSLLLHQHSTPSVKQTNN